MSFSFYCPFPRNLCLFKFLSNQYHFSHYMWICIIECYTPKKPAISYFHHIKYEPDILTDARVKWGVKRTTNF